ncbi:RagB/SusD family nutrient uptake outer membrane protein [Hymenobacter sublimis]|uniref:RagB/SusD family nutrient uptake outer membrane protein n=1 Tax=Hymenobacter sublimis TaxID=2933777 RepID=A0ABY4J5Q2_9BACT|nr:RagB/SusD family nutrient uptake outer membrane protein [Hymenobacter sublimis]UPL48140.1 RagB/SusD family nutrient uptake outer membrane protein [Hymenobacter sublimis]
MNIRSKFYGLALLGLLGLASTSCSDFLNPEPLNSIDRDVAFTDLAGAQGAVVGLYGNLTSANNLGLRVPIFADLLADNLDHTGTFPSFAQLKSRNPLPDNAELNSMYSSLYSTINRANNIIAQIPNTTGISDAVRGQLIGEAQFVRAYCYFMLTNYWGDVALVLTPTTTPDNSLFVSRTPREQVYNQIRTDLDAAESVLPAANVGRATRWSAIALKSRLALYRQQWADAARFADQVIAGPFTLASTYRAAIATRNPTESIWEIQFDAQVQSSYAFFMLPTANGGRFEMSPGGQRATLLTAYETGDQRRSATISDGTFQIVGRTGTVAQGNQIKYFDPGTGTDTFKAIRLAEMFLNSAEAKAQQQDIPGALVALNRVRTRAGLPALLAANVTQTSLLEAIERERRVELALEGHRWFDLIRTGRAQSVLGITDATRLLMPIPNREIVNNPNMKQNPGY